MFEAILYCSWYCIPGKFKNWRRMYRAQERGACNAQTALQQALQQRAAGLLQLNGTRVFGCTSCLLIG